MRERFVASVLLSGAIIFLANSLYAGVVVLNNRTNRPVLLSIQTSQENLVTTLEPTSSRPFFSNEAPWITYQTQEQVIRQQVALGSIYYFSHSQSGHAGHIALRQIALGKKPLPELAGNERFPEQERKLARISSIRLMVYVDEEEMMTTQKWQERLKARVAAASEVIRLHTGLSVDLVGFGRWQSDNRLHDFSAILADFEAKVTPPEGIVAVGFSSQLELHRRGKRRLGGTRGPLRSHLLVREWAPQVSETERIEVLVHELGHYLGASHSPEPTSVMRPTLGASDTRLKSIQIQFDPLNTLAIATVSEELRNRKIKHFEMISPSNRMLLASIYHTLNKALPDDPSSAMLAKRASRNLGVNEQEIESFETVVRRCLSEVTKVAAENRRRPLPVANGKEFPPSVTNLASRIDQEGLTNLYIKTIAKCVADSQLSADMQARAFIFTIPLAIDRTSALNRFAYFEELSNGADPIRQRQIRMNVIGQPTAQSRSDSLLHFVISAAITLLQGEEEARFWGYAKEAFDSLPDGTGFSFADIAADEAGIRFAKTLRDGSITPAILADRFEINHFMPSLEGLVEGLSQKEFVANYGSTDDERYSAVLNEINRRIELLPPYFRFSRILSKPIKVDE